MQQLVTRQHSGDDYLMVRQICLLLIIGALSLSACGSSKEDSPEPQTEQAMLQATIDTLQATVDAPNSSSGPMQPTTAAATAQPTPPPEPPPSQQVAGADISSTSVPQEATIREAIVGCWRIEALENADWGMWLSDFLCFMADGAYFASYFEGGRYELSDDGTLNLKPNRMGTPVSILVEASTGGAIKFSSGGPVPDSLTYTSVQENRILKNYLVGKWEGFSSDEISEFTEDGELLFGGGTRAWYAVLDDNTILLGALTGSPEIPENGGVLYTFRIHVTSDDEFELVILGWDPSESRLLEADEVFNYVTRIE